LTKPHAVQQLAAKLTGNDIDAAVITETHLKSKHTDDAVNIPGYVRSLLHRRDRQRRRGGGVADLRAAVGYVSARRSYRSSLYHPPRRPQYQTESLLDYIKASINELNTLHPAAFIALAGDFNQLTDNVITERTGLVQIVHQPARGHNKLDRIFVSNLAYSTVRAVTSVVKSDHIAVIASYDTTKGTITKTKSQHKYRPKTATQHARFLDHLAANISFVPPDTVSGSERADSIRLVLSSLAGTHEQLLPRKGKNYYSS